MSSTASRAGLPQFAGYPGEARGLARGKGTNFSFEVQESRDLMYGEWLRRLWYLRGLGGEGPGIKGVSNLHRSEVTSSQILHLFKALGRDAILVGDDGERSPWFLNRL